DNGPELPGDVAAQQGIGSAPVAGPGLRCVVTAARVRWAGLKILIALERLADQERAARLGGVRHWVAFPIDQAPFGVVTETGLPECPEHQRIADTTQE